jgi:hypothetical protein
MTWSTRRTSRRAERLAEEKGSVISALGLHATGKGSDATTGDLDGASFWRQRQSARFSTCLGGSDTSRRRARWSRGRFARQV